MNNNHEKRKTRETKASKITPTEKELLDTASSQKAPRKRKVKNEGDTHLLPIAEKTDLDHTKRSKVKRYWKVPENIAVEPEVFQEQTEEVPHSSIEVDDELVTEKDEQEQLDMIRKHNEETFGTHDQQEIDRIIFNNYNKEESLPESPEAPIDLPFEHIDDASEMIEDEANKKPWKATPKKLSTREIFEKVSHPGARFGKENLKTTSFTKAERHRNWLDKLTDFFSKTVEGILPEDDFERPTEEELQADNNEKRAKEDAHYAKLEREARADINAGWRRNKFPREEQDAANQDYNKAA